MHFITAAEMCGKGYTEQQVIINTHFLASRNPEEKKTLSESEKKGERRVYHSVAGSGTGEGIVKSFVIMSMRNGRADVCNVWVLGRWIC